MSVEFCQVTLTAFGFPRTQTIPTDSCGVSTFTLAELLRFSSRIHPRILKHEQFAEGLPREIDTFHFPSLTLILASQMRFAKFSR